jgi:hypothetical protein
MKSTPCLTLARTLLTSILLLFGGGFSSAQLPDSFPTEWKFEVLQDESSVWWNSLRVNAMVQGFTAALPAITANVQNSVSAAANYTPAPSDPADRAFFRVTANWALDSDGDGRFDWQEIIFDGNSPFAADSNGDGIWDVAQDNSGPEPSLDDDSAALAASVAAPRHHLPGSSLK